MSGMQFFLRFKARPIRAFSYVQLGHRSHPSRMTLVGLAELMYFLREGALHLALAHFSTLRAQQIRSGLKSLVLHTADERQSRILLLRGPNSEYNRLPAKHLHGPWLVTPDPFSVIERLAESA